MGVRFATAGCMAVWWVAVALVGCSGGSGPLVTSTSAGRDSPPVTRDTPPATRDSVDTCLLCDVRYDCTTLGGQTMRGLTLSTADGMCTPDSIALVCSGVTFGATSCTGGGGGPFTCGATTCVPVGQ